MSLPAAVLAGGLATRLGAVSLEVPKALVDVAGDPFAVHQLRLLAQHGVTDVVFLVGHLGEMMCDALGDGSRWGVRIQYAFDGAVRLGTGGAIRRALPLLGEAFLVLYGDSYLECDYGAVERAFRASGKNGLMTVHRNDDQWDTSNVLFENGTVVRYDKAARTADMHHIDYGLGVFRRRAFAARPENIVFDLAGVYQELIANNDLAGYEIASRFYEIGSPAGLEETRVYLAAKERDIR